MPFISRKEYRRYSDVKGYLDAGQNGDNMFFKLLSQYFSNVELPPVQGLSRLAIANIYQTSAPVMGVINYIADNVADVSMYLELTDRKGNVAEGHWLTNLLLHPNDRDTLRRFVQGWAINRNLFDDAWIYAPKEVGRNRGQIKAMYVVPSQLVEADRGGAYQPLRGIKLSGALQDTTIGTADIIESCGYSLDPASFFGSSKIVAAATYLSVIDKGMRREDTSLQNGGVANIVTPAKDTMGVMPKDADAVEARFNAKSNYGKTVALRVPIDVHTLGNAPIDLNILESHKEAVTALCFVYKIPVDLYYGQAKYENAKEAKKTIYEQIAIPQCNEFAEDLLHHTGLDKEGYRLQVNVDKIDALKANSGEVLDNLAKMHATLNEMREANGYPRIEEAYADEPMLAMGTQFGNETYDINE